MPLPDVIRRRRAAPPTAVTAGLTAELQPVTAEGRLACPRCGVRYAPALVGNACPVCGVAAPGLVPRRRTVGDNAVLLVGLATISNVLLLAVLAIFLLR